MFAENGTTFGETAKRRVGERANGRGDVVPSCGLVVSAHCDGERLSVSVRAGANTLIPDGLNDGSQGIPRPRMRVKIRRKPWGVPRLRGPGEQGLRLGTRRV
jgi:hypothetical protein